jgi:hypothetical protein
MSIEVDEEMAECAREYVDYVRTGGDRRRVAEDRTALLAGEPAAAVRRRRHG